MALLFPSLPPYIPSPAWPLLQADTLEMPSLGMADNLVSWMCLLPSQLLLTVYFILFFGKSKKNYCNISLHYLSHRGRGTVHLRSSENNFCESLLSYVPCGSWECTQVLRLGSKCFYLFPFSCTIIKTESIQSTGINSGRLLKKIKMITSIIRQYEGSGFARIFVCMHVCVFVCMCVHMCVETRSQP